MTIRSISSPAGNPLVSFHVELPPGWTEARSYLAGYKGGGKLRRAMHAALKEEASIWAEFLRRGIEGQAPGGKAFTPLKPLTIEFKRSKKALIHTRKLLRSIRALRLAQMEFFAGVVDKDAGKIARLHEHGRIIIQTITAKQTRWFFWRMRNLSKAGLMRASFAKVFGKSASMSGARPSFQPGAVLVTFIPKRPFMVPTAKLLLRGLDRRICGALQLKLGGKFGIP